MNAYRAAQVALHPCVEVHAAIFWPDVLSTGGSFCKHGIAKGDLTDSRWESGYEQPDERPAHEYGNVCSDVNRVLGHLSGKAACSFIDTYLLAQVARESEQVSIRHVQYFFSLEVEVRQVKHEESEGGLT